MKFLCLLLALIMSTGGVIQPQKNVSAVDYITNNFSEFISEYNKIDDNDCNATFIEYQTEIYVNDTQTYGYYLDFNDDNGFCIVTGDEVIDMYTTGDFPEMKEKHEYVYDIMDGFLIKENGEYIPYAQQKLAEVTDTTFANSALPSVKITNAEQYVKKVYGSKYKPYKNSTKMLSNFNCIKQSQLSVYLEKGTNYSEGNCTLASIYSTLNYLRKTGVYPKISNSKFVKINTTTDSVNKQAKKEGYYARGTTVEVPELYAKIREIAIAKYGYDVNCITICDVDNLVNDVLKYYGYKTKVSSSTTLPTNQNYFETSFESTIKRNINKGYPVIFSTYSVYGGPHCISVIGYSYFRNTYKVGFVKINKYAKLLIVADNHLNTPTYFDYTRYFYTTNSVYFK